MITVRGHRVLVKVEKLEDVDPVYAAAKKAGLAFAEHLSEHQRAVMGVDKGTVVEVGSDAFKQFYINCNPDDNRMMFFRPWCEKGDTVAFAKYSGKVIEDPEDGQKYVVINDEDVVAVLKGTK